MGRFIAINVTSPNIPVSQIVPDRPLAYFSLQERVGIMEISVQLSSAQHTQNCGKFALNIQASAARFIAINVTSPNTPVSQAMPVDLWRTILHQTAVE